MTSPIPPREPWDDRRLEAAFAARASRTPLPTELVGEVVARARTADPPMAVWRRWLPAAAVVVLAVGVVAGGIALSGDVRGRALFRPGPTADLKTLDTGEFAFDYPAAWHGYDASASGSGFSSIAVLGTQPVERRCGNERHIDLNCVYEQRIEPGQIRLFVGTGAYRGQTIEDRAPIENGSTSRVWVGGMPAIFDAFDPRPDSFYGEDQLVQWEIARPTTNGTNVVRLEAMLKEPGVAEARRQLDTLVASFRFTKGPEPTASLTPEPTPTEAAPRLGELPVKTVEDLIAAAETPTAGEVVVRGWLARSAAIVDCQIELDPHPLIPYCADFGLYLTDEKVPVDRGVVGPSVPHVVPMLRVDAHTAATIAPGGALEVLALGHQLDHRWTTCPDAQQAECKTRFVIDRVVLAGQPLGDDLPTPWASPDGLPVTGPSDAVQVLSSVVGGVTVVSIGVADPDALRSIEWQTRAKPDLQTSWVIRALIGGDAEPIARTFLVGDEGHPTVFEVTETGIVDLIGQPASAPPTEVLGLPVISVEEAIVIRDAGRDDREIAVRGWFPPSVSVPCPRHSIATPLESGCQSMFEVLMADEEQLIVVRLREFSAHGPSGLAISIHADGVDQSWKPVLPTLGPVDLIAVGHFDDRRSSWCDPIQIDACRDRFVVDRVEWVDGATQPLSLVIATGADGPVFAPVEATVIAALPDRPLLSAAVWRGADLGQVEPSLREERLGITDQAAVWIVRVLDDGRAATYLVIDGTDRIYVVETDGQTVLVGGAPAENRERTWPPTGVLDVPMPEGAAGLVAKAGVVDRSGLLVEARAAGEADPRGPTTSLLPREMSIVQAAPDTIIAYWEGSLCDDRFVLTVYGDRTGEPPDRVELRGERAKSCRLALATRGLVLRFSQPIDAKAVRGWERVGTPFETFPPVDSTVVSLPNDGGFALPKVRAALVDLSGRIKTVRLPRPTEILPTDGVGSGGVLVPDRSVAGRYQLAWVGGQCAPDITITINAALSRVVVTNALPPDPPNCDTIAQVYRLILDIDGPLDPPTVEVRHAETSAGAS